VDILLENYTHPSEILDGFLFLGNIDNAKSVCSAGLFGIDRILSVLVEPHEGHYLSMWEEIVACTRTQHQFLRIEDAVDEDISELFSPACEFLEQARIAGSRVIVHCLAGRSRSAAIVLAYLMRCHGKTLYDGFMMVKNKRPAILPNVGFWKQLRREEMRIFGLHRPCHHIIGL